jgi:hypothetical protein
MFSFYYVYDTLSFLVSVACFVWILEGKSYKIGLIVLVGVVWCVLGEKAELFRCFD